MRKRKPEKPRPFPPCEDTKSAEGRARRESRTSLFGDVAIRFRAMVGDEARAAYSQSFVDEYRQAWGKSWPYLCQMLELIEQEETYLKPWFKNGVEKPAYQTFAAYCEAEVEPFVGPVASLREQYRRLKNGEVDLEEGARNQQKAQTIARCRDAYRALQTEGKKVTQEAIADRAGTTQSWISDLMPEIIGETATVGVSPIKPTKVQKAKALSVSLEQLRRIETVAKHSDLQERTELPKDDPDFLSIRKAYLQAREREGKPTDIDPIRPVRRDIMKLSREDQRKAVEWVVSWGREQGFLE